MTSRQITSLVILSLCGMALYVIPSQIEDGDSGFLSGASLMPELAVSLILLFTLLDLVFSLFARRRTRAHDKAETSDEVTVGTSQLLAMSIVAGTLVIYGTFMLQAGYVLSSAATVAFLMVCTGGRRPVQIAVTAFAVSAVIFLGLRFGFGVNINAFPNIAI